MTQPFPCEIIWHIKIQILARQRADNDLANCQPVALVAVAAVVDVVVLTSPWWGFGLDWKAWLRNYPVTLYSSES